MEIDLNSPDENKNGRDGEQEEKGALNKISMCMELWHACAGPLIFLPKKGSLVVYFPQGHIEQLACSFDQQTPPLSSCDLPPEIFCRVLNVNLLADQETDEVFAQVTLVPQSEPSDEKLNEEEYEGSTIPDKATPHMFCKTLTASDTSTHGGFSVPRRAAEDCFPPLDYSQQRPSQELIAKDLHGVQWKFRHIYRGQPRRHLLTTGWSVFVSHKGLVSGDAVLFLRDENGQLRLGIRRNNRKPSTVPSSLLSDRNVYLSIISAATSAVATKSMFHVFYNPRRSPAEFVIPYSKYVKSCKRPLPVGTRFRMRFESEDPAEKSYSGIINAIEDVDPVKWPGSKWRSLKVDWDEDMANRHEERVSPWEIEPSLAVTGLNISSGARTKRFRSALPTSVDNASPEKGRLSDFGESAGFSKVLQGQEIVSFKAPGKGAVPQHSSVDLKGLDAVPRKFQTASTEVESRSSYRRSDISRVVDFGESMRFQKVLQGQENFSVKPPLPAFGADSKRQAWEFHNSNPDVLEMSLIGNGSWVSSGASGFMEFSRTSKTDGGYGRVSSSLNLNPLQLSYQRVSNTTELHQKFVSGKGSERDLAAFDVQYFASNPKSCVLNFFDPSVTDDTTRCKFANSWTRSGTQSSGINPSCLQPINSESVAKFDVPKMIPERHHAPFLSERPVDKQSITCRTNLSGSNTVEKELEVIELSTKQAQVCAVSHSMDTKSIGKQSCKLFGISLIEEPPSVAMSNSFKNDNDKHDVSFEKSPTSQNLSSSVVNPGVCTDQSVRLKGIVGRKCTKVHKQGSVVGRAIDLSKLDGYEQLITELEQLFNMEGQLRNPENGWQVVYTDNEDDVMLVGDDPWQEFCNIVCKILIYTHDEVQKLKPGMFNDDAVSCSDEQPSTVEISKSSSCRQDSS